VSIVIPVLDAPLVGAEGKLTGPWRNAIGDLYRWVGAGAWQSYDAACSAPGYAAQFTEFRAIEGEVELSAAFKFTGNGGFPDVGLSLPIPAYRKFGQFTCFANVVSQPLVVAVAAIFSDGVIHILQSGAANWPSGSIYVQLSGRYRTE
jgi:hypothetical protein